MLEAQVRGIRLCHVCENIIREHRWQGNIPQNCTNAISKDTNIMKSVSNLRDICVLCIVITGGQKSKRTFL